MIDASPRSQIFDALLDANPWARPHWDRRLELIDASAWNINAMNQGGNNATRDWLAAFNQDRSAATEQRLLSDSHADWNAAVADVVTPLFQDRAFAEAHEGTPMTPVSGGALVSSANSVAGYALGQFKADILMLGQAALYEERLLETLDLSGMTFTIGIRVYGGALGQVIAHETRFGPYSDFVTRFGSLDVSGAEFYGTPSMTTCDFAEDAIFAGAEFFGGSSFQAVRFGGLADFTGARFHGWAAFAGAVFDQAAIFREAVFMDDVTFEHAMFNGEASFRNTQFDGGVGTNGLPKSVIAQIDAARR